MSRLTFTLRGRVTCAAAIASAFVLALAGTVTVALVEQREWRKLDGVVERNWQAMVLESADRLRPQSELGVPKNGTLLGGDPRRSWTRVFVNGRAVLDDGGPRGPNGIVDHAAFPPPRGRGFSTVTVDGARWRVFVEEAYLWYGRQPVVQAAVSTAATERAISRVRGAAIAGVLAGLALSAWLAWTLSGRALRPLARLRTQVVGVSTTDDLNTRVPEDARVEEIDALSHAVNVMLDRLRVSAARQRAAHEASRRLTADAGHELRTPLTSLTANLDTLAGTKLAAAEREKVIEDASADAGRLAAILQSLQTLARGDVAGGDDADVVDLAELADGAVESARRYYPDAEVSFRGPADAPVLGTEDGLRTLIENLISNAARHAGPNAHIEIAITLTQHEVLLTVDDDGPGIPVEERHMIFERFTRGKTARGTGSGLGLAIAAQQAELHRGTLAIADAPRGGTRFILALPHAPDAAA